MTEFPAARHSSLHGRWYLACIGLFIAMAGGLFMGLMARSFLRAEKMRSWPEVPCVILSSEIEERVHDPQSPMEFRHAVSFGYQFQGMAKTGEHTTLRSNPWTSDRSIAEKRAAPYPSGLHTTCRVDPANPDFAVLKPDSLAPGYSIWFPCLFFIGGIGIFFRALFPTKSAAHSWKNTSIR